MRSNEGAAMDSDQRGWYTELQKLIDSHGKIAALKPKEVSHGTRSVRAKVLFNAFRLLGDLNARPRKLENFKPRHMQRLVDEWLARDLSASTLQNYFSVFVVFCTWINKAGMLGELKDYVPDESRIKRTYAAQEDKSWSASEVDPYKMIDAVSTEDMYVGIQLKLIFAFGLRVKEAVMFHPYRSDQGQQLLLTGNSGTKGGRQRHIPITSPYQRQVLDEAKRFTDTLNGHLGNPRLTLKQNLDRFYYVIRKHGLTRSGQGVTAHGLRHEFLASVFERISGLKAPIKGGGEFAPDQREIVRLAQFACAEAAGHSRFQISTAYCGQIKYSKVSKENSTKPTSSSPGDRAATRDAAR